MKKVIGIVATAACALMPSVRRTMVEVVVLDVERVPAKAQAK
jgi:hypothetical protein